MDFSESDEDQLVVDEGQVEVDDSICPICNGSTYSGETISCEKCTYWFHFECVGVTHDDACVQREDIPFYCSKCGGKKKKEKVVPKNKSQPKPKKPKQNKKAASPSKTVTTSSPPIKLKISIGKKKPSKIELSPPRHSGTSKRRSLIDKPTTTNLDDSIESLDSNSLPNSAKKRKRHSSEDEEEQWLEAVESGNLQKVDAELKSINDPKKMTSRQRAMVDRKQNNDFMDDAEIGHMSLSYISSKKSRIIVDEEENQKIKAMKSAKRKEIELEKREQDRIKTMERLLNKKESNAIKTALKSTSSSSCISEVIAPRIPKITYVNNQSGISLTFPEDMKIPIAKLEPREPKPAVKCAVFDCNNLKRYNCSKTGRPLCSLECYKKNLIST